MLRKAFLPAALAGLCYSANVHAVGSCGDGGILGTTQAVDFDGSLYYVSTPSTYDPSLAWPLILGLHGDEGDPASSVNWFWQDVVDDTFIFVAPKAPNASGSWYEEQESNSVWMDNLLASVLDQYNVDLDRVFIWGLSGGAEFTSTYAFERQDVFAAVEMNMGGAGRGYDDALSPDCRAPARFVVSTTDFLRDGALGFFEELTAAGHETVWVDADCMDHCFDEVEAGPVARDWFLAHTLCGATPTAGCREGTPGDSEPTDTTTTTGSGGGTTGTDSSATVTTTGAVTDMGGTSTGTAGGLGGSAMATMSTTNGSTTDGGSATSTTSGVDGTTGVGGSDPTTMGDQPATAYPDEVGEGCACELASSGRGGAASLPLLGLAGALLRRRRRKRPRSAGSERDGRDER